MYFDQNKIVLPYEVLSDEEIMIFRKIKRGLGVKMERAKFFERIYIKTEQLIS